jgi:hypothetical protein
MCFPIAAQTDTQQGARQRAQPQRVLWTRTLSTPVFGAETRAAGIGVMMLGAAPGAQSAPPAFYGFKRQISPSLPQTSAALQRGDYGRGGMGFRVSLRGSNPERLISALGQKTLTQCASSSSRGSPQSLWAVSVPIDKMNRARDCPDRANRS